MVRVAAYAGLRQGELLALRWRDIDFAGSGLTIARAISAGVESSTKSGRVRRVPLADQPQGTHWYWPKDIIGRRASDRRRLGFGCPAPNPDFPNSAYRALTALTYQAGTAHSRASRKPLAPNVRLPICIPGSREAWGSNPLWTPHRVPMVICLRLVNLGLESHEQAACTPVWTQAR